ncbi:Iron-sulfur cluster regulator IscR [uncultured Candidatus Thioglobus sp.]|nr:Iron-sulfur cluster regulator IscR [uncultured Candidatus Thioglobus sp.]
MRLTTKGRYAVSAMLDIALASDEGPTALADIAKRQNISLAYLEQLFAKLRKNGLVFSVRGPNGGYCLARKAEEISAAHIIYASGESVDGTRCGGQQNCLGDSRCLTHDLWMGLNQHISNYLNGTSLGKLVRMNKTKQALVKTATQPADLTLQYE